MKRHCMYCGEVYAAKRSTSKFCSDKCRNAYRDRTAKVLPVNEALAHLRETQRELDALSVIGPEAYRELCAILATTIEKAMEEVGL